MVGWLLLRPLKDVLELSLVPVDLLWSHVALGVALLGLLDYKVEAFIEVRVQVESSLLKLVKNQVQVDFEELVQVLQRNLVLPQELELLLLQKAASLVGPARVKEEFFEQR